MKYTQEVTRIWYALQNQRQQRAHSARIRRDPSHIVGDKKQQFRLSDEQKHTLATDFHLWGGKGDFFSSERRVEVFLAMMTGGGFYRQIGHTFGLAKSIFILHTSEVSEFIFMNAVLSMDLPIEEEFEYTESSRKSQG